MFPFQFQVNKSLNHKKLYFGRFLDQTSGIKADGVFAKDELGEATRKCSSSENTCAAAWLDRVDSLLGGIMKKHHWQEWKNTRNARPVLLEQSEWHRGSA